jgi:CheY-like chemotaxis protein
MAPVGENLASRYRAGLAGKAEQLSQAWERWLLDADDAEALKTLRLIAHRLAGSAEPYGYADIGRHALCVDEALTDWESAASEHRPSVADLRKQLVAPVRMLITSVERAAPPGEPASTDRRETAPALGPVVLYLDDDPDQGEWWRDVLAAQGLRMRWVAQPELMAEAIIVERPQVLLVDYWLAEGTSLDLIRRMRAELSTAIPPVVCLTVDDAVLAGSIAMGSGLFAVVRKSATPGDLAAILRAAAATQRGERVMSKAP